MAYFLLNQRHGIDTSEDAIHCFDGFLPHVHLCTQYDGAGQKRGGIWFRTRFHDSIQITEAIDHAADGIDAAFVFLES